MNTTNARNILNKHNLKKDKDKDKEKDTLKAETIPSEPIKIDIPKDTNSTKVDTDVSHTTYSPIDYSVPSKIKEPIDYHRGERENNASMRIEVKPVDVGTIPSLIIDTVKQGTESQQPGGNIAVDYNTLDIKPIYIDNIQDTKGLLSERIKIKEDTYNFSILPFEFCKISQQVVSLKGHNILSLEGMKFSSSITRIVNTSEFEKVKSAIISSISNGTVYEQSLWVEIKLDGKSYKTVLFNDYELATLQAMFRFYNPKITRFSIEVG